MADLIIEQNYYDALLSGWQRGQQLSGQSTDLSAETDAVLQKAARKQAIQLQEMVVESPAIRARMVETVNEWLHGDVLDLNELRAELRPVFGEARALMIARTETARTMNIGNSAALRENGWSKVIWMASAGACDACEEMNGTVMSLDEYDNEAILHPNCYPGDVLSSAEIRNAYKAVYSGDMLILRTAGGLVLPVTPNHPIASNGYMIRAGDLRHSDYLMTDRRRRNGGGFIAADKVKHNPSRTDKIFNSLRRTGFVRRAKRPDYLYGDGALFNSDVEIVGADVKLPLNRKPVSLKRCRNGHIGRVIPVASQVNRGGAFQLFAKPHASASRPLMRRVKMLGASGGIMGDRFPISYTRRTKAAVPAALGEKPSKGKSPYSESVRQAFDRMTGIIEPDQLIAVDSQFFNGHVYDLATSEGLIIANHIAISNCACTSAPIDDDVPDSADIDAAAQAVDADPDELGVGEFTAGIDTLNE